MNETTAVVIWIVAVMVMITIAVRWFLRSDRHDYIDPKDYTLKDFYTRKRK